MSNTLVPQIFEFDDHGVRIIEEHGELWFVAKDIARILGYSKESPITTILNKIPFEWVGKSELPTLQKGSIREMVTVSEQGLYFWLGRCDKSAALPFQKWVAGEVLPSIRKTGKYAVQLDPIQQLIETNNRLIESVMRERALVEQNTDLKVRLNEHLEYLTVAKFNRIFRDGRLTMKEVQELGKKLTEYCRLHRIEIRKCETQDERFAYTNSYPLFVWEHFYPDDCFDCLLLQEFQNQ